MKKEQSFGLRDIADLVNGKKILLPTVQRGFVWKPSQIENLWDSLLRGYPVGAIVLAPQKNDDDTWRWSLLDGQQRLTTICLGLGRETFRKGNAQIKIFIDLIPPDEVEDPRKFVFRAITRSHPWGYQRNENTKTLDQPSIRKALDLYDDDEDTIEDPMAEEDFSRFFPYDAKLPIPFEYFVDASSPDEVLKKAESTKIWQKILGRWMKGTSNASGSAERDDAQVKERIANVLARTSAILKPGGPMEQRIPALYLDLDVFHRATKSQAILPDPAFEQDEDDEDAPDEIENLFVRLNAGGTPLRGEELNYSVLKSQIDRPLQEYIEECCNQFYDPARFITIAYRLFQAKPDRASTAESAAMRIKPKQFQRAMADKGQRDEFLKFLKESLGTNAVEQETLLSYARKVLTFDLDHVPFGLPYPVAVRLSDEAPEIVFLLLYRIWYKHDRFLSGEGEELHRKMLGVVSLLAWLGKESGKKGYRRLLNNIWPAAKDLPADLFWSAATIRRGQIDGVLPNIPNKKYLKERTSFTKDSHIKWHKPFQAIMQEPFIYKSFFNRSLILFAQRKFLAKWFPDRQYHLSDTDAPFDWDHISPHRFVDNKRGVPDHVRTCYNMIGNFRAWPYSLNRMDQDEVPANKLNPLNEDNFLENQDYFDEASRRWTKCLEKNAPELSLKELPKALREWSYCTPQWLDCKFVDLKKKKDWTLICRLIIDRNLKLCEHWFQELRIDSLRPDSLNIRFEDALNMTQWRQCPEDIKKGFDLENRFYWVKKVRSLNAKNVDAYFYIGTPLVDGDELGILAHEAIDFGIYEISNCKFICNLQIPDKSASTYMIYDDRYVEGFFTLVSDDEASYTRLFRELWNWLNELPRTKEFMTEIVGLAEEFNGSLKGTFAELSNKRT